MWFSWLGCLVFVFTVLEMYSYLSEHAELSILRRLRHPSRPAILRPGQYRETVGHQNGVDNGASEETWADETGVVHDRRLVRQDLRSAFCPWF